MYWQKSAGAAPDKNSLDSGDSRELKGGWGVERENLALSPFFTTSASPWMRVTLSHRGCDGLIFAVSFFVDNHLPGGFEG